MDTSKDAAAAWNQFEVSRIYVRDGKNVYREVPPKEIFLAGYVAALARAEQSTETPDLDYWKSRAETAELKVLTFYEEIAKLRSEPALPQPVGLQVALKSLLAMCRVVHKTYAESNSEYELPGDNGRTFYENIKYAGQVLKDFYDKSVPVVRWDQIPELTQEQQNMIDSLAHGLVTQESLDWVVEMAARQTQRPLKRIVGRKLVEDHNG